MNMEGTGKSASARQSWYGKSQMLFLLFPSSNDKALRFEGTVSIKPNALSGLTKPSVALLFQIQPIDVPEIIKRSVCFLKKTNVRSTAFFIGSPAPIKRK